jgi:drug/metabolite transporter (DMT)-like permease
MKRNTAVLMLIVAAVLWSLGGFLIKSVEMHPLAIAGTRSAIAMLVIWGFVGKPQFTWSKAQLGGALAYAATVMLFVAANRLTTAANAILLQFTSPIYVALLAQKFLKEKNSTLDWVAIAATFAGIAMFFVDSLSPAGMLGNVFALLNGVSFACLVIFLRYQKEGSPIVSILLGNALTALIGLPFVVLGPPAAADWLPLIVLGVVQLGIPYILYSLAIKHVSALDAILIPVLEPLLNPVWAFLLLDETPGRWALLGGVVVLASVTLRHLFVSRASGPA